MLGAQRSRLCPCTKVMRSRASLRWASASSVFGDKNINQCGVILEILGSVWDKNLRNLGISFSSFSPLLSSPLSLLSQMPLLVQTILSEGMSHIGQRWRQRNHPQTQEAFIHEKTPSKALPHPVLCVFILGNTALHLVIYWICLFLLLLIRQYLQSISCTSIIICSFPFTYFPPFTR